MTIKDFIDGTLAAFFEDTETLTTLTIPVLVIIFFGVLCGTCGN